MTNVALFVARTITGANWLHYVTYSMFGIPLHAVSFHVLQLISHGPALFY